MNLSDHIIDTLKEWELKMGQIDSDIRLYYPPDSVCDFLGLPLQMEEQVLIAKVKEYLNTQTPFLGVVKVVPAKDHRIGVVIPREGSTYVAEHMDTPVFLQNLLQVLKQQSLQAIKDYFADYAGKHGGQMIEETEDDGIGCVLYFDKDDIDPYVYCFDSDAFGVTYHRFSRSDYEKLR